MLRICTFLSVLLWSGIVLAQPSIYNDNISLITGTWIGNGTLTETTANNPYEGIKHYQFTYNYTNWWAGFGLNMDNWGNSAPRDFSGYSHIRIAYKGLSGAQTIAIRLRNGNDFGNEVVIGPLSAAYTVVNVSMVALLSGSPVSASAIREIDINIGGEQVGSGTVYVDDIKLVNMAPSGQAASATTMARAATLDQGFNSANWLEAWWLIPFNAYPETNKYTRAKVQALRNAGFTTWRLPVIFERLGSTTPPYDLDFNHPAFALVDSAIVWAQDFDMKLIIDNHHGYELTNANYAIELPRLEAVWEQLTDRYNYLDPERYFFELYNEPTPTISNANFAIVANALLDVIRANETQTHSVFVGGNSWNSGGALQSFPRLDDADVIYTFHCYDPYFFTHQGMSWTTPPYLPARTFPQGSEVADIQQLMAGVSDWAAANSVPASMGEFGCSTQADATSRCNWIQTMTSTYNAEGLSAFYWDAITPSDAFGFYTDGIIDQAHVISCFSAALGLYSNLPVSIESIDMDCIDEHKANLIWKAHTEYTHSFEVQYSENGTSWKTIATVAPQSGNVPYQFATDQTARFYRLKMLDHNGDYEYSPIIVNRCRPEVQVEVFPNPATQFANIRLDNSNESLVLAGLYDAAGQLVMVNRFLPEEHRNFWALPVSQLPAGVYHLEVVLSDGARWHEQVVKY